jgi:hypothetical protein
VDIGGTEVSMSSAEVGTTCTGVDAGPQAASKAANKRMDNAKRFIDIFLFEHELGTSCAFDHLFDN